MSLKKDVVGVTLQVALIRSRVSCERVTLGGLYRDKVTLEGLQRDFSNVRAGANVTGQVTRWS